MTASATAQAAVNHIRQLRDEVGSPTLDQSAAVLAHLAPLNTKGSLIETLAILAHEVITLRASSHVEAYRDATLALANIESAVQGFRAREARR